MKRQDPDRQRWRLPHLFSNLVHFNFSNFQTLPKCDLPKFGGYLTEFQAFWDQFVFHLSKAAKLIYLRSCLTGKASEVTSGLSCSNTDCEVALSRLREEFNRPAKVIQNQIKKLAQTPPNGVGLRSQYGRKCDRWARNRGKVVSENASCSQLRSRFPSVMIAFRHQSGSNGLKKHWHQAPRGRCDVRFDMRSISRVPLESGKSGIVFEGSAVH
ncbi:hypothetical protein T4D_1655 [Trichinella pseudospiralis]|uniref:Uncharacterized protein n=2 Tax=Trichinella pseudospiralis TaxID=6337 RepID=A0A0V1G460_TRIPS|nr:hypothetical protein T4D_1655 [Trichinella pseudospiralis]